jgi:hypothetical protein
MNPIHAAELFIFFVFENKKVMGGGGGGVRRCYLQSVYSG